jgi:hypothetical protein
MAVVVDQFEVVSPAQQEPQAPPPTAPTPEQPDPLRAEEQVARVLRHDESRRVRLHAC